LGQKDRATRNNARVGEKGVGYLSANFERGSQLSVFAGGMISFGLQTGDGGKKKEKSEFV